MYKNCNTEESAQRQQQLEECLLKNMLARPYSDISVSDLCQQAGISRKSFYRYFGNKDGCLNALLDRVLLDSTKSDFDKDNHSPYPPELFHALEFWTHQKPLLDSLTENGLENKLVERAILHTIHEEKDYLRWMGIQDANQDSDTLLFAITGYITLILNWNKTGFQKPLSQMCATLYRLMTRPLICIPEDER